MLVEGDSYTSQQTNEMKNSNDGGYAEVNGTSTSPAAATIAAPSSGGHLSGLGSWASSKMTSSARPSENANANTSATHDSAELRYQNQLPHPLRRLHKLSLH